MCKWEANLGVALAGELEAHGRHVLELGQHELELLLALDADDVARLVRVLHVPVQS